MENWEFLTSYCPILLPVLPEGCGRGAEFLSLVLHAIAPGAGGINMPTEWLEQILSSAADAGVVVRGMR